MTWERGETTIRDLIDQGSVEQVSASREQADALMAAAVRHLVVSLDPEGAYAMTYDAARKALTAILTNQGLRVTAKGGHVAIYAAVRAQLDPPLGKLLRPFQRMRVRRNEVEYPSAASPGVTVEEVIEDLPKAHDLIEVARNAIPQMSVFQ